MSGKSINQSSVIVKNGVMTITTCTGQVHQVPTPGMRDFERFADPNDPHAMVIENVEIRPRGVSA